MTLTVRHTSLYRLSPDELVAKDFRRIHSSRPAFYPHGERDWIMAIKKVYQREGDVFAGRLHIVIGTCTIKAFGSSVIG